MSMIASFRTLIGVTLVAAGSLAALAPVTAHAQTTDAASAPPVTMPPPVETPPSVATLPPPSAAPAAPAEAVTEKQVIDNPYGLEALWAQGDMVARTVLIIMLIMSMGSWYIIFTKLWEQHRLMKSGTAAAKDFWAAGSIKNGINVLKDGSAFRYIAESGVKASEHHEGTLVEQIDLHTWVSMSVQRAIDSINSRLQDGLAFLATVGSTAPFVGLFGTVWGIYHALTAIGISGQASIDKVAGPVGEALIMTAIGLAVAVPAVMGYNWLIRRNK
ncbi:MAG: MotA/TolQ/ExbB proton channel family protein, partial [Rubrivivax sp.]